MRLQLKLRRRRAAALFALMLVAGSAWAALPGSAAAAGIGAGPENAPGSGRTPFDRQGMWIWYVSHSERGNVAAIIARARKYKIGTVYVKSGDGSTIWNQFNGSLVQALHKGGIRVCAWQFVYGDHPAAEAKVAATSVARGADCFVIDAEGDYEGKYAAADLYMRKLRAAAGDAYPIGLAGFPYVDYHPGYPYSVFLGPGGATFNLPQMYWKTIGTSVRTVFEHTYLYNRIWGHPIYPLGQTYEAPGNGQLQLFRRFSATYGNLQPSWWDWQETTGTEWAALSSTRGRQPLTRLRVQTEHPMLKRGARGDMVVWAQEHLFTAGYELEINGIYGAETLKAVRAFQEEHGLEVDGRIGTDTWAALLTYEPYRVPWSNPALLARSSAEERSATPSRPLSATLPAKGYELGPSSRP